MARRSKKRKEVVEPVEYEIPAMQAKPATLRQDWIWAAALVAAVFFTYLPVWWAGYIWDDDDHLTANPCIVGPLGFIDIWTTAQADISPLTRSTFWLEHALWGLAPLPYHLVNVLLHGACAVVLWQVLRKLQVPGAWLGAAIWALHPVQVESVAWITEMKNTESGLYFLLSIFFYLRWLEAPPLAERTYRNRDYILTLLFAALAMACKSSTVILPLVLCLCAWWKEGRWNWRNFKEVAPVFVFSAIASTSTIWTQKLQLAMSTEPELSRSWSQRLAEAGEPVWFYLGKLIAPYPLATIYPRSSVEAEVVSLILTIALLVLFWRNRETWARPWFFAFAYFVIALLPVLGLVNNPIFRYSLVFDHFQYLASMGPLAFAGAGLVWWTNVAIPDDPPYRVGICAVLLFLLAAVSWHRNWVYENRGTLWTDAISKNPQSWAAHNGLGSYLLDSGKPDEAIAQFRKALEIDPGYAEAHNNLGTALKQKGHLNEAIEQFGQALGIKPGYVEAHYNLANTLVQKGKIDDALDEYHEALKLNPDYAEVHYNLGSALLEKGEKEGAVSEFRKAIDLKPSYAQAHMNLGNALLELGQVSEGMAEYQKAVAIDPNFAEAHNNLGLIFAKSGHADDAIVEFEKTVQADPSLAEGHRNLGVALYKKGDVAGAIAQFQELVRLDPQDEKAKLILHKMESNAVH